MLEPLFFWSVASNHQAHIVPFLIELAHGVDQSFIVLYSIETSNGSNHELLTANAQRLSQRNISAWPKALNVDAIRYQYQLVRVNTHLSLQPTVEVLTYGHKLFRTKCQRAA